MANINLTFHVQNQHVSRTDVVPVLSGSVNIYSAHFTFGSEWTGLIQYVQFGYTDGTCKTVDCILTEGSCAVPAVVYANPGAFTVSCYGVQMEEGSAVRRITTEAVSVTVYTSAYSAQAALPTGDTNVYVRTGAYDVTVAGKTGKGTPVPFILCTADGTLCYYDSTSENYVPVRDAYRAAADAGYTGTEVLFYNELSALSRKADEAEHNADLAQSCRESVMSAKSLVTSMYQEIREIQTEVGSARTDAASAKDAAVSAKDCAGSAKESALAAQAAAEIAQTVENTLADKLDLIRQLKDCCTGKAFVDYITTDLTVSHSEAAYETAFAPALTQISAAGAFSGCTGLKQLYFPSLEGIAENTFSNCTSLNAVYLPSVKTIGTSAFQGCTALTEVDLGKNVTTIGTNAFNGCAALNKLIMRADSVVTLSNSNAFIGTIIIKSVGSIYVPGSLVEEYKAATNWVYFKTQIKPLSELGE